MSRLHSSLRFACTAAVAALAFEASAFAGVPVQRTFFQLPTSNGHGAAMLDLSAAQQKVTHFREHLYATEEPLLDGSGNLVNPNSPQGEVATRGLLYDAYFGLRAFGQEAWLTSAPVDLDASGYAAWTTGKTAGTGVATMVQTLSNIEATTFVFAPMALPRAGFVMAVRVVNKGTSTATGVSVFSLHNLHLGFGRPGVMTVIGDNGETITFDGTGHADFIDQGFAGVVVARALGAPTHHGESDSSSPPTANLYDLVLNGGAVDYPDLDGAAATADGAVSGYQWDFGDLAPGAESWAGVVFATDGDPTGGGPAVQKDLDALVKGQGAKAVVDAEIAGWASFQGALDVPNGLSSDEETLLRQSAVVLKMAQVTDENVFLREFLTMDGEARYTAFGTKIGGPPATLPATVAIPAKGQVIASLPPGEWTISWARDMAYSSVAMSRLGMKEEARAALDYYMKAVSGRFQSWMELQPYSMPPYQVSLCRYFGFGEEETDANQQGPNLEFDGLGLNLWAARHYEDLTKDTSFVDQNWDTLSSKVADVLVALVNPQTGLLQQDSSIWETHWDGWQRTWTYSNITAVRGLCDASALATRKGDSARAKKYGDAAKALRKAIVAKLTDKSHALASNAEELAEGEGYWDAAVLDGIAMGLFDPKGLIAKATFGGIENHLRAAAGEGWSRNDDDSDHAGGNDLSPWGSDYDSAEWVFTDMRGAVAARRMGNTSRADALVAWTRKEAIDNYLAVSETYDQTTGTYKFNAPMVGFGAGAWTLALAERDKALDDPACGAYFDESDLGSGTGGNGTGGSGGGSSENTGGGKHESATTTYVGSGGGAPIDLGPPAPAQSCGCRFEREGDAEGFFVLALALAFVRRVSRPRR